MESEEENQLNQEIRQVYNSGDCKKALELACDFLKRYPDSPLAKHSFAAIHGDYASSTAHDHNEKKRLLDVAKRGMSELLNDPRFAQWPERFRHSIRNEY